MRRGCIRIVLYCIDPFILRFSQHEPFRSAPGHSNCVGVKTPKRCRQLRVKDLSKVPTWRLEWDSNLRPSGWKALNPTTEPLHPTDSGVHEK